MENYLDFFWLKQIFTPIIKASLKKSLFRLLRSFASTNLPSFLLIPFDGVNFYGK